MNLKASFVISFSLHILVVIVFWFNGLERVQAPLQSVPVQLVRLGKPRDEKLLPRIEKTAPPPEAEGIALSDEPTPKDKRETKVLSDRAKQLLNGPDALDETLKRLEEIEGQEDGDKYGTVAKSENAAKGYAAKVTSAILKEYVLPETISPSERRALRARVVLFIDKHGNVLRYDFVEKSNNDAFVTALDLLLKKIRLPPPPEDLRDVLSSAGLEVLFRP